jgi:enterochelin esterase family protein
VASLALAAGAFSQKSQATGLETGKSYERTLSAGAADTFTLDLRKGAVVSFTLKDNGKDAVILTVLGPPGDVRRAYSSELQRPSGAARFLSNESGAWTLKLSAKLKESSAIYTLSVLKIASLEPLPTPPPREASPRIARLKSQQDVTAFWQEIGPNGGPLVEPLKDDAKNMLVTFLWHGDAETTGVLVNYPGSDNPADCLMTRLAATDLWYKSVKFDRRDRTYYTIVPNPPDISREMFVPGVQRLNILQSLGQQLTLLGQRDPLNPKGFLELPEDPDVLAHRGVSKLELPGAPAQPWADKRPNIQAGKLEKQKFASALLKNSRDISIYTPPDYAKDAPPYDLLFVFDGDTYINVVPTPTTLDNLIADKRIAPTVAVIIGNAPGARSVELPCNPDFADFLNAELMPWVRRSYNVTGDARHVTIGGSSYGGLAATYAAFRHPETFGNVLSQSGSYWWTPPVEASQPANPFSDIDPSYVAQLFVNSPRLPVRFYLDAGTMELDMTGRSSSILVPNRHLRDVLRAKGYEVFYQEFHGAHDYVSWRGTIADGLILLGGGGGASSESGHAAAK